MGTSQVRVYPGNFMAAPGAGVDTGMWCRAAPCAEVPGRVCRGLGGTRVPQGGLTGGHRCPTICPPRSLCGSQVSGATYGPPLEQTTVPSGHGRGCRGKPQEPPFGLAAFGDRSEGVQISERVPPSTITSTRKDW